MIGSISIRQFICSSSFALPLVILSSIANLPAAGMPRAKIKQSVICCPHDSVTFDGWASVDPGGEVVAWLWDMTGDGAVDTITDAGEISVFAPEKSRTCRVILAVRDNEGNLSAPDTAMFHVMESRPSVREMPDVTVQAGTRVLFEPEVGVTCSAIARYEWDLDDDGNYEYRSRVSGSTSKVYLRPGKYRTHFRVIDDVGKESGCVRLVTVIAKSAQ